MPRPPSRSANGLVLGSAVSKRGRAESRQMAQRMCAAALVAGHEPQARALTVIDDQGRILFSISFADVWPVGLRLQ